MSADEAGKSPRDLLVLASIEAAKDLTTKHEPEAALRLLETHRNKSLPDEIRSAWQQQFANATFTLAMHKYAREKDAARGAQLMREAVAASPDNLTFRLNAGLYAWNHHQYELAVEWWDPLLELKSGTLVEPAGGLRYAFLWASFYVTGVPITRIRQQLALHADAVVERAPAPVPMTGSPGRKIRMGYLCAHFGVRNTNGMIPPMLAHHDREKFEIYAYSTSDRLVDDDVRRHIIDNLIDGWRDLTPLDDQAAADLIRRDEIDILIDWDGLLGERLTVVAAHPALMVGGWWHNFETFGRRIHDFVITDDMMVPPEETRYWAEEVAHLPGGCFEVLLPKGDLPPVSMEVPQLRNGYVTFGSYAAPFRISRDIAEAWAKIMASFPNSRLVIRHGDLASRALEAGCRAKFTEAGIDLDRVSLVGWTPLDQLLSSYDDIDLHLDCYPGQGGNTTLDAMMQGVPTITCKGDKVWSRMGPCIMRCVGLPELVADDLDDYVRKAIAFAGSPELLARYRASLRDTISRSPMHQPAPFMHGVESVLIDQLRRHHPEVSARKFCG